MKKTLLLSLLSIGCATMATADNYTYTSKNWDTPQNGGLGGYIQINDFSVDASSFNQTAGADKWTTTTAPAAIDAATAGFINGTKVSLDQMTFYSKYNDTSKPVYSYGAVLVITSQVDGSVIKSDEFIVADSATQIGNSDKNAYLLTFNFDAADQIVLGHKYNITIEKENGTEGSLSLSVSQSAGGKGQDWYVGPKNNDYAPVGATVTTSSLNVPEPTTATLSLVALAGLMIRRRRNA